MGIATDVSVDYFCCNKRIVLSCNCPVLVIGFYPDIVNSKSYNSGKHHLFYGHRFALYICNT